MDNKVLHLVRQQIGRLGGTIEDHEVPSTLSPTLAALEYTWWNRDYTYAHHTMDQNDERRPQAFEFDTTEIEAAYVKSEPDSGGWLCVGYDAYSQHFFATPVVCRKLQNPPVYAVDHEVQYEMRTPVNLLDFLRSLEVRQDMPQAHFLQDGIRFENDHFANIIRRQVHKVHGHWQIGTDDLERVMKLDLSDMELTDVGDLVHLQRVAILDLSGNESLADIQSLAALPRLHTLTLNDTQVDDLSPLAERPLGSINISRTAVTDISPLLSTTATLKTITMYGLKLDETQQSHIETLRQQGVDVRMS